MNMNDVEIIRRWYDTHDPNLINPECVWEIAEGFPHGGTYTSAKAVLEEFFPRLLADFEVWNAEVSEILDAEGTILSLGQYRGQTKANSVKVNVPFVHLWKVRNDKIVWFQNYTDTLLIARALQKLD